MYCSASISFSHMACCLSHLCCIVWWYFVIATCPWERNILFRQQRLAPSITNCKHAISTTTYTNTCINPQIHSNNVCTCIYHAAFPSGSGWLSLALVPWSIKKPNRTDWLTRVLPTPHPQSDMNILASLRSSNAYYCATTTSFLPYVIRVVRDVMDHGTARGRFSLGRLLACFALIRTWLALLYLSSNYSQA
jgi:hypothetical protein